MLRAKAADIASRHGADRDRHVGSAAGHVAQLCGVVGDLVHADGEEVIDHDFGDRPQTGQRCADGSADDGLLGNRRRPHPVQPVLRRQAGRGFDYAARRIMNVLAQQEHPVVAVERQIEGVVDGLP